MESKKKVFILVQPDIGHIYPLLGMARILIEHDYEVIFYSRIAYKDLIEKSGSLFRRFKAYPDESFKVPSLKVVPKFNLVEVFTQLIDMTYIELPHLLNDIVSDRPVLIIYDHFCLPVKLILKVLEVRFNKRRVDYKPKIVKYFTCFASLKNEIQPVKNENVIENGIVYWYTKIRLFLKQVVFNFHFGTNIYNTLDTVWHDNENLNIVTVLPELQPLAHKFDPSFKFVGSCIEEKLRNIEVKNEKLKNILDLFEPINPNYNSKMRTRTKLIYCSFGTLFNNNLFLFEELIEAVNSLNDGSGYIKLVMAVGESSYEYFLEQNFISNDIIIVPFAPQISLLERADLFITHCGMNSASEAIHFGVPLIGIPVCADQPQVSDRLANQLKFGIEIRPFQVNSIILRNSILEIFNNKEYSSNIIEFSKVSQKYNGCQNAANLILNYIG